MSDTRNGELLGRSLDDKAVLRHELRRLPVEDKMKVVALMQRRANEIRRATGRPVTPEWSWEVVGITANSPSPRAGSLLARLGIFEHVQMEQRASAEFDELRESLVENHPGVAVVMSVYSDAAAAVAAVNSYLAAFTETEPVYQNLASSEVTGR